MGMMANILTFGQDSTTCEETQKIQSPLNVTLNDNVTLTQDNQHNTGTYFEKARKAYDEGKYKSAFKILKTLADKNNAEAQLIIGEFYESGKGVPRSYKHAAEYYQKAINEGHLHAQYKLGTLYRNGKGVDHNVREAAKLFRLAAKAGDPQAQNSLGLAYTIGAGVPKSYFDAYIWFLIAKNNGYERVINVLEETKTKLTKGKIKEAEAKASLQQSTM